MTTAVKANDNLTIYRASYIHYYFVDNESSVSTKNYNLEKRKALMKDHQRVYKANKERMLKEKNNANSTLGEIIDSLTGKEGISELEKAIANYNADESKQTNEFIMKDQEGNDIGIGSIANRNAFLNAKAENIAMMVDSFKKELDKVIQQAYNTLCKGESWKDYKNSVIEQYCALKKNGASYSSDSDTGFNFFDSKTQSMVVQDFLTHEGFKKVKVTDSKSYSKMENCLRSLILLAESLPEYGDGANYSGYTHSTKGSKGKNSKIKDANEFYNIIARKVNGLFSNVKGEGAELAVVKCAEKVGKEIAGEAVEVVQTGKDYSSGPGWLTVSTNVQRDPELEEISKRSSFDNNVSKGDVRVIVTEDKIQIVYGLSVKQYNPPSSTSNFGSIDIVSNTNFYTAAKNVLKNNGLAYLENLAAGHGNGGGVGKDRKINNKDDDPITTAELNTMWDDLSNFVIAGNALQYLVGLPGENTMFLVYNGKVTSVDTIIDALVENPDLLTGSFSKSSGSGKPSRNVMMRMNKWIPIKGEKTFREAANERSNKTLGSLEDYLTKMTLTVNMKLLSHFVK